MGIKMSNNQMSKNDFIREQIKEKPLNKRKMAEHVLVAALCGIAFALTASIVFLVFFSKMKKEESGSKGDSEAKIELSTEAVTEREETSETERETEKIKEPPVIVDMSLSLEDYQELQNELYNIGSNANRSIVSITSVKDSTDWFNNSFEMQGQGSGVVIADPGEKLFILTDKNVISDVKSISVTFRNEAIADAKLYSCDMDTGIAIISVEKKSLDAITLQDIEVAKIGNSKMLKKGAVVIALGSPLGTSFSVLTGNITSTDNMVSKMDDNFSVFTTDIVAAKNSSGVLINTQGDVIGLVMQGYSNSEDANILTAVGISEVTEVIQHLVEGKEIPYLGMKVITVNGKIARDNDIPEGVYIKEVAVDSPAMLAGLQSGDVITQVDKRSLSTVAAYSEQVMHMIPGEEYPVIVQRQGANGYYEVKCKVEAGVLK